MPTTTILHLPLKHLQELRIAYFHRVSYDTFAKQHDSLTQVKKYANLVEGYFSS